MTLTLVFNHFGFCIYYLTVLFYEHLGQRSACSQSHQQHVEAITPPIFTIFKKPFRRRLHRYISKIFLFPSILTLRLEKNSLIVKEKSVAFIFNIFEAINTFLPIHLYQFFNSIIDCLNNLSLISLIFNQTQKIFF